MKPTTVAALIAATCLTIATVQTQSGSGQKPTFRSDTRLVQVSAVVRDRDSRPVPDLTAADFQLLEDGEDQPIALFSVHHQAATRDAALPLNTFTNRLGAAPAGGVTVILYDRLNTRWEEQGPARDHLIRFVGRMRETDRVGLYVLESSEVRVVHDFTRDASSLLRALARVQRLTSIEQAAGDDKIMEVPPVGIAAVDAETERWLRETQETISGFFLARRAESTLAALEAIAHHLQGVPGRKNLIWISGAFPAIFNDGVGPGGRLTSIYPDLLRATRALSAADVAIYPVDARGLVGAFGGRPADRVRPFTTLGSVMGNVDTMRLIADSTGGRAFYNTNDLGTAIERAADDSRLTYLLGYYPTHGRWDGKFRRLTVKVRRRGVQVGHRSGYLAFPMPVSTPESRQGAIERALISPLDSTAVTLSVDVRSAAASDSRFLKIAIEPAGVTLMPVGDMWEGTLDLAIAQGLPDGRQFSSLDTTIPLRFSSDTRGQMLRDGLSITRTITLRPDLHQLRVVVRDDATGAVGTVTIPAARLRATDARSR